MTVSELLAAAPSSELVEWAAFYRIEREDADAKQKKDDMAKWVESVSG